MTRRVLVCGAGGFIGNHLVRSLKRDGHWVRGVDLRHPPFSTSGADEFLLADLRDRQQSREACASKLDEVYQLAGDMGGAGYIFTGAHDAAIMSNSAAININVLASCAALSIPRILFTSSACVYPAHNQTDPDHPVCVEESVYPAWPDSEYGWEKLFAERLYLAYARTSRIAVRIARLHNVYGPENPWRGGREKAPAAICRKVALACDGDEIEIWGDGRQTRSFMYIDDCLEGLTRLMRSSLAAPVNLGSDEMVSIAALVEIVARIAGKRVTIKRVPGPEGVRGRTSDNQMIARELGWQPRYPLRDGLARTYAWIADQAAREGP